MCIHVRTRVRDGAADCEGCVGYGDEWDGEIGCGRVLDEVEDNFDAVPDIFAVVLGLVMDGCEALNFVS